MTKQPYPILYSLHNCPYAIRARMALVKAKQVVEIRSIKLSNKPIEMVEVSPKGSVPVLVLPKPMNDEPLLVIDESLDIMLWALNKSDPYNLLQQTHRNELDEMLDFIKHFENRFIPALEAYAAAKRYHQENRAELRKVCEGELVQLEGLLNKHRFLLSDKESLVDIALVPFIRKLARVDKPWFRDGPFPYVRDWLNGYLNSRLFSEVMTQYDIWHEHQNAVYFGDKNKLGNKK
ncbi:glutathione S-transferase [Vibrio astriarenae]|uniref:Glutathione S-transferase n=1 Tax=Vibrio astriarenae TaxID=1481923 RepID=A0A7Z2T368_9VIBR|nr:glutathione S-transferase [Vibrio astriarenae]QIA63549.1 glutathione S-transferase [Vibrio astriarenae]